MMASSMISSSLMAIVVLCTANVPQQDVGNHFGVNSAPKNPEDTEGSREVGGAQVFVR